MKRFAKALEVKLDRLPLKKSAPEKVTLAAAMKVSSSVPNAWIAERLAMGRPASVSQFVRRFRLAGQAETRSFRKLLSQVKQ